MSSALDPAATFTFSGGCRSSADAAVRSTTTNRLYNTSNKWLRRRKYQSRKGNDTLGSYPKAESEISDAHSTGCRIGWDAAAPERLLSASNELEVPATNSPTRNTSQSIKMKMKTDNIYWYLVVPLNRWAGWASRASWVAHEPHRLSGSRIQHPRTKSRLGSEEWFRLQSAYSYTQLDE